MNFSVFSFFSFKDFFSTMNNFVWFKRNYLSPIFFLFLNRSFHLYLSKKNYIYSPPPSLTPYFRMTMDFSSISTGCTTMKLWPDSSFYFYLFLRKEFKFSFFFFFITPPPQKKRKKLQSFSH